MKIDILTIFPDFFRGPLDYGIVRKAREAGLAEIEVHDLRAFARDRHRTVDDRPFGGGEGMVLKPEPIFECIEGLNIQSRTERLAPGAKQSVVLLSAQGRRFDQGVAEELATLERIVLICGRYEGVDERVGQHLADRELSIGDYVLSGGELGAAVILDTVTRLIPGAVGNEASTQRESFTMQAELKGDGPTSTCASGGLLDYPHYTRPADFRGMAVPEILVSGNHDGIRLWRRRAALEKTMRNRPDLLNWARSARKTSNCSPRSRARKSQRRNQIMTNLIIEKLLARSKRTDIPNFAPGDTVRVHVRIKEGDKERLQAFEGVVISRTRGPQASFTVRKISFGHGVERIFPINSKVIDKVDLLRSSKVRRAKLYYLRGLRGKAARLRDVETEKQQPARP